MSNHSLYTFAISLILFSCYSGNKTNAMSNVVDTKMDSAQNTYKKTKPIYLIESDSEKAKVIGVSEAPISKAQPESTMGNLITDAMLEKAQQINSKTAIAILNYNSIKLAYLSPGNITQGDIQEMLPFKNKMILLEIPGTVLQEFCDHIAKNKGWPISGISFAIKDDKAINILVNNKPINDHILYLTAVPNFLTYGGNHCEFLRPLIKKWTDIYIRDLLIEHITNLTKRGKKLHPQIEDRIIYNTKISEQ